MGRGGHMRGVWCQAGLRVCQRGLAWAELSIQFFEWIMPGNGSCQGTRARKGSLLSPSPPPPWQVLDRGDLNPSQQLGLRKCDMLPSHSTTLPAARVGNKEARIDRKLDE